MVSNVKHILIAAGGTGGHVYPALAVADYLRENNIRVTWVGTSQGLESRVIPAANIPLEIITISGLRGKGVLNWIYVPVKLIVALYQAVKICLRVKPDAVMGMGGFVSGPCGLAAFILRKPLYVHEQNAIPGLTNRVLSHVANTVMQAFPESFKHNHGVVVTGNPVRKEITELVKPEIRMTERKGNMRLLIVGGSLGAQVLNENVPQALAALDMDLRPDVWHQAGKGKLETTIQDYKNLKVEAKVTEFIDNMADAYEWADLVICRAGALTVSELASAGLASILVPYAYAVDDHQTANAKFLTKANAAILIPQDQLAIKLKVTLSDLLQSGRAKLIEMAMAARQLSRPDATKVVAQICLGMTAGSASGVTHG